MKRVLVLALFLVAGFAFGNDLDPGKRQQAVAEKSSVSMHDQDAWMELMLTEDNDAAKLRDYNNRLSVIVNDRAKVYFQFTNYRPGGEMTRQQMLDFCKQKTSEYDTLRKERDDWLESLRN